MTHDEARQMIVSVLGRVAPEIDPNGIDPDEELGADLDLDSMDFLNLVEGVAAAAHIDIPERDYPELLTLGSFTAYVERTAPT
jgi:acyl carrier protein